MATKYPEWVLIHKKKGVEIRYIHGKYYAYKVKSTWDSEKKRPKKITEKYLGSITQGGLIPPKHEREQKINSIKEFGNIFFANSFTKELASVLKQEFPEEFETIMSLAILKLCYNSSIKNYFFRNKTSYTSELYPNSNLSPNKISELFHTLGYSTISINKFFSKLNKDETQIAIDLSTIFTDSESISYAEIGYNSKKIYHDQLQFLMLYSITKSVPTFFKVLPGSVRDVSSLVNAIKESECKQDVIIVSDRGFYSEDNLKFLESKNLKYVLPLRKNSSLITYSPDEHKEYFIFQKRPIWHRELISENKRIIQFLDKKLMVEEDKTFINLVENDEQTMDEYFSKKDSFGIISIISNTNLTPKEIYQLYKKRNDIEVSFGIMKHSLDDDKTYMQSTEKVKGYFFITFLALYLYSKILNTLREKELLEKYSVKDVLMHFSKIYKINTNNGEIISEVPKQSRLLLEKLGLHIA